MRDEAVESKNYLRRLTQRVGNLLFLPFSFILPRDLDGSQDPWNDSVSQLNHWSNIFYDVTQVKWGLGNLLLIPHFFATLKDFRCCFVHTYYEDRPMWCSVLCVYLVTQLCPTLRDPMDCSPLGTSVHGIFQRKNTGVGCYFFFQGIFLTQGSKPTSPMSSALQADSLPTEPSGFSAFNIQYEIFIFNIQYSQR